MKATLFLSIAVTIGLLAAVLALGTQSAPDVVAIDPPGVTPTPTPGPSRVQSLKIDTDPTSNGPGPSGLGPWDSCVSIDAGEKVAVDVVVELLPPVFAFPEAGLSGFGFNILYDQAIVSPTAESPLAGISMLTNVGSSSITSSGDPFPDSDGDLKVIKLDGSTNYEYGSGTLIRLEFTGVAPGDSTLTLSDTTAGNGDGIPNIYRSDGAVYDIGFLGPAHIVVDGPCPTPSPSPVATTPVPTTPGPTPTTTDPGTTTPTPTPVFTGPFSGTPTPGPPSGTSTPTPTATATATPAPTPTPSALPTPSPTPPPTTTPAPEQCNGLTPTILGTDAPIEVLIGTSGNDVILGREGHDVILGLGGNDTICGGTGHDIVIGGRGNDWVDGGPGLDICPGPISSLDEAINCERPK